LISLFNFKKGDARLVKTALTRIDRRRLTVRVELEHSLIRFNTRLSVKRHAVVVAKPAALGPELLAGSYVRFKVPDDPHKEVRLQVTTPHFNLTNNQPVFLCTVPTAFAPSSQRKSDRFDTSRFTNLRIELPSHGGEFRVLDISQQGCRISTPFPRPREHLPPTEPIGDAVLRMGRNVSVPLATAVPRTYDGRTVGMSFAVDPNGDNRKLLMHLLRSLETAQREALRAEAL